MRCGPALTNICLLRSLIPVINNSFWLSYSACISIIRVSKDLARDLSYSWFSPPIMFQPMERRSGHHEFLPHLQITWTSLYSTVYSLHINIYIFYLKKWVFFFVRLFLIIKLSRETLFEVQLFTQVSAPQNQTFSHCQLAKFQQFLQKFQHKCIWAEQAIFLDLNCST